METVTIISGNQKVEVQREIGQVSVMDALEADRK